MLCVRVGFDASSIMTLRPALEWALLSYHHLIPYPYLLLLSETDPCDWITGWDVFERLLTPNFLNHTNASPPAGHIHYYPIKSFIGSSIQCPSLLTLKENGVGMIDEDLELELSHPTHTVEFPSRDEARVLNVGSGNSVLSAEMLKRGFMDIVNIDYSKVVVEQMKQKYDTDFLSDVRAACIKERLIKQYLLLDSRDDCLDEFAADGEIPSMTFEYGDITKGVQHSDEAFDLIICKKTLDVILCSAGSVADARSMMSECFRLLNKEHGVMIIVSSAKPEDRAVYFENDPWTGVVNIKLPISDNDEYQRKGNDR